ncbi:hypothetical protein QYF61_022919 [Mycteria americana]|uniref:EF-hand domain-containing protein n=1 Tax=Mycteria americana TaxID=33587 RepID=A0AAN7N611_MYCAM|nr:hypothetical protein QYF61_022919 [Mycteria americana]
MENNITTISREELEELREAFSKIVTILGSLRKYKNNLCFHFTDIDNSGYVSDYELQDLFKEASLPLPGYKVREIVEKIIAVTDSNKDGRINFEEFVSVRHSLWMFLY